MKFYFPLISALVAMIVLAPAACTKGPESGVKAELPADNRLSNPSAGEKTKAVYRFLCENYGKKLSPVSRSRPGWDRRTMKWT